MSIANPIYSAFRFYFPKDWFVDEVRSKFGNYFRNTSLPYNDISDYINDTIINAKIPGVSDPMSSEQIQNFGDNNRKFPSSLSSKRLTEREINVSLKVKESYLNWMIMMYQFDLIKNKQALKAINKTYLPSVYLQIMDHNDNIIMEMIYKDIIYAEISDIEFSKQSNGLISTDFDVKLHFNEFELKLNVDNIQSNRDNSKHVY